MIMHTLNKQLCVPPAYVSCQISGASVPQRVGDMSLFSAAGGGVVTHYTYLGLFGLSRRDKFITAGHVGSAQPAQRSNIS